MTHPNATLDASTRAGRKDATRQALLRHAVRRARRAGFSQIRTADVAADAGLSHGAVFVHFPTRESLLREVAATIGRAITDRLHAEAAAGSDLRAALTAHLAAIEPHEAAYRSLLVESAGGGVLLDIWTGIQSAVAKHLSGPIATAMGRRPPRALVMPLPFNGWIALVHHYVLNAALLSRRGSAITEHGAALVDFYASLLERKRP